MPLELDVLQKETNDELTARILGAVDWGRGDRVVGQREAAILIVRTRLNEDLISAMKTLSRRAHWLTWVAVIAGLVQAGAAVIALTR